MNEISSEFSLVLEPGVYDQNQVHQILQTIQKNTKSTVSSELDLMTRMNILLLQQILTPESSINWGLLEDENLLNKIKEFEIQHVTTQTLFRSRLDQSVRDLQNENLKLQNQCKELQSELDQKLEKSNAVKSLLQLLERKNLELQKLQS
jgi:stalled ribosome alternative rescue factor ArfA